jgi:glycosyltransferase involved in cell wall biosynthesis
MLGLSIVVPVFNEADNLEPLYREIRAALHDRGLDFEILFVDDGSTDATPSVLRQIAGTDPAVRVLRLPRNSGQTAAFGAGFRAARGEVIATLDADLQNDPADLPRLLDKLDNFDVVCGVRQNRRDSWVRRMSSRIANAVRNRMTHESISDVGCSLRVFRRSLVEDLPLFTGMHRFLPTLLRMQGARLHEVPVRHRPRLHGQSKYGIQNRLWVGIVDLFAVRWMQRRWIDHRSVHEVEPAESDSNSLSQP